LIPRHGQRLCGARDLRPEIGNSVVALRSAGKAFLTSSSSPSMDSTGMWTVSCVRNSSSSCLSTASGRS
jgi:hypothetical protein